MTEEEKPPETGLAPGEEESAQKLADSQAAAEQFKQEEAAKIEQAIQETEEAITTDETARQQQNEEANTGAREGNVPARQAVVAIRAGAPLTDEPLPEVPPEEDGD